MTNEMRAHFLMAVLLLLPISDASAKTCRSSPPRHSDQHWSHYKSGKHRCWYPSKRARSYARSDDNTTVVEKSKPPSMTSKTDLFHWYGPRNEWKPTEFDLRWPPEPMPLADEETAEAFINSSAASEVLP